MSTEMLECVDSMVPAVHLAACSMLQIVACADIAGYIAPSAAAEPVNLLMLD